MSRRNPTRRATALLLLVATLLGGCRAIADEFSFLDRAGPVADGAPDRALPGDRQVP